jgi:hypothetical protein
MTVSKTTLGLTSIVVMNAVILMLQCLVMCATGIVPSAIILNAVSFSVIMPIVINLVVIVVICHFPTFQYAECRYVVCYDADSQGTKL